MSASNPQDEIPEPLQNSRSTHIHSLSHRFLGCGRSNVHTISCHPDESTIGKHAGFYEVPSPMYGMHVAFCFTLSSLLLSMKGLGEVGFFPCPLVERYDPGSVLGDL